MLEAIGLRRLRQQGIVQRWFERSEDVAGWFGALQAQNRSAALWALGLRCASVKEQDVEQSLDEGRVVRTWLLRGTLHVAAANDVRWMLGLLAPRLKRLAQRRWRELNLDENDRARAAEIFRQALHGGKRLTRAQLFEALEAGGVSPEGQRGYHLLSAAAVDRLICFGPMQGKTDTFVLLDEWAPADAGLAGEGALAELARRYFRSHGPAKLEDFVWWSGLTMAQARQAIETAGSDLQDDVIAHETYWTAEGRASGAQKGSTAVLLPAFDEFYLGYRDRSVVLDPQFDKRAVSSNGIFRPAVLVDGQIVGIWQATRRKGIVRVELDLFQELAGQKMEAVAEAARAYGAFLGLEAELG